MNTLPLVFTSRFTRSRSIARPLLGAFVVLSLVLATPGPALARVKPTVLRLATLLPRGSSWMRQLNRFAKRVKRRTRGHVVIRCFPGAIMGDERDMIRKMRQGRLDVAALSGTGLGQILPASRVLEMPLLFRDIGEAEAARNGIAPTLIAALHKKGFELLSWGELGWIRYFSRRPLRTLADLRRAQFWTWTDDPLATAITRHFRLRAVKLPIQDVLPALQTGMVTGFYATPYIALALQWYAPVRYYSPFRISYGVAGLVIRRSVLEALPLRWRRLLRNEGQRYGKRHIVQVRRENKEAIVVLERNGLTKIAKSPALLRELLRLAPRIWASLTGKLFSKALLKQVILLRDTYRRRHGRGSHRRRHGRPKKRTLSP
ncbi:MAG: TRAP transporter substrate-binding protein DctP [Deltaproteobacteria bacterium]|nr:TRAP transporter substrate-binding protein DctP [Deltaproteobacteria bacterium]